VAVVQLQLHADALTTGRCRTAVGVELDAELVERSRDAAARCGVTGRTSFLAADFTAPGFAAAPLCPGHPAQVSCSLFFTLSLFLVTLMRITPRPGLGTPPVTGATPCSQGVSAWTASMRGVSGSCACRTVTRTDL